MAPPGNQAVNGENKHQPAYREKPVYSTQLQFMIPRTVTENTLQTVVSIDADTTEAGYKKPCFFDFCWDGNKKGWTVVGLEHQATKKHLET